MNKQSPNTTAGEDALRTRAQLCPLWGWGTAALCHSDQMRLARAKPRKPVTRETAFPGYPSLACMNLKPSRPIIQLEGLLLSQRVLNAPSRHPARVHPRTLTTASAPSSPSNGRLQNTRCHSVGDNSRISLTSDIDPGEPLADQPPVLLIELSMAT